MTTHPRLGLGFVFALAAASTVGCSSTAGIGNAGGGDDTGSDTGTGSDPTTGSGSDVGPGSNPAPLALELNGTYTLASTFDLSTNMPGAVGTVVNDFIDATDGPNDPTQWIMDQLIAQLSGSIQTYAQDAEPLIVAYANDEVTSLAPTFVADFKTVGQDFADLAQHFGLVSTLAVTGSNGTYTAVHTVTGVHFVVGATASDYLFADYAAPNITVPGVGVTMSTTGDVAVASHVIPLSYGEILHIGLDAAILPLVDPNATDLNSFFADEVDCAAVGQAVANAISFGSAGTYQAACTAGLDYAATLIYNQIDAIHASPLVFTMSGAATATDTNSDGKIDQLAAGIWTGTITYVSAPAPMATATFTGTRD